MEVTVSKVLVLASVVCFVLATVEVATGIPLVPLGLALLAASFLV